MPEIILDYGLSKTTLSLPDANLAGILEPAPAPGLADIPLAVTQALEHPLKSLPLKELLLARRLKSVLLILSDHTRIIPHYHQILEALCAQLAQSGIDCNQVHALIATGSHRAPTCEERKEIYGQRVFDQLNLFAHDCDKGCISVGKVNGRGIELNEMLLTSGFTIATGKITPHYLAGFSGGRKAVMPGCASRATIAQNHALIALGQNARGKLEGNPVHHEMEQSAALARIDFILNVVPTPDEKIAGVFAGHWQQAWLEGTKLCRQVWSAKFDGPADCVIASAGGHPLDIDLYQIQRILNNVAPAVKPGGTIVLVGHCPEGAGQIDFGRWMRDFSAAEILQTPQDQITAEAHRAYATALVMKKCRVCLVSGMDPTLVEKMQFKSLPDLNAAVEYLRERHGKDFSCYVVPKGNAIMLE
ncbi:nickel-dependent lactate racemase [candidate division TA06 bacterium]|uniref:Nickel-dependent lactate racemase n=1 Tax=candidate division TA06 bacterium TaxID=2250710 RepID=A0A933MLD9_UNCT6|nr:nickel-dependent lactate racemase [candidate division TA06 bacterium]